jgi:predicted DnaQ family exonuclease/DinG family helicase
MAKGISQLGIGDTLPLARASRLPYRCLTLLQTLGNSQRPPVHPLDLPCVAVAITGLGPALQAIRFQGSRVLEQSSFTLGSPASQGQVAAFLQFLGEAPMIGHDVPELLNALAAHGVTPLNQSWDTQALASLLLPGAADPSLAALARLLGLRSEDDGAEAVWKAYLVLMERAGRLSPAILQRLAVFTTADSLSLGRLLHALADSATGPAGMPGGIDHRELEKRLERPRSIGSPHVPKPVDAEEVEALLSEAGPLAKRFPYYEPRPEQVAMAKSIARALMPSDDGGTHLLVEGGTGIGKSVAYLLPAILFAARNNVRVVISTNTINLQEQLVRKDIPDLLAALSRVPGLDLSRFRYTRFKGKANYLCLRRWEQLAATETVSADEARTLAKTLVWLQETKTGDRTELALRGRELAVWDRLSAAGFSTCPGAREGACFYRHAREEAAAAHLVVVNHALLLSDLLVGGTLLPEYDFLVLDEAHNLEEEATRQFGFRVSQGTVEEMVERFTGILQGLGSALRFVSPGGGGSLEASRREALLRYMEEAQLPLFRVRDHWGQVVSALAEFARVQRSSEMDQGELRITPASRAQPAWSELEIVWDNFDSSLGETERRAGALVRGMEQLPEGSLPGAEKTMLELGEWIQHQGTVRQQVAGFVTHPENDMVYWVEQGVGPLAINGAPLEVASRLQEMLFTAKQAVVLTSATLTVRGEFNHLKRRLGLEEAEELSLGSPFDYERAALLTVPTDMPEPNSPHYQEMVASVVQQIAIAAGGHTMGLFTSHAAVRTTALALRGPLAERGIGVLAQGVDGTPQQLLARFQEDSASVLLGTASFWEGVDIGNGALKVLALARLPFNVPTEPVFAARSEQYERPFLDYAVPLAVLRFRQGFGRLIRSKTDRGAVVVLDGRIHSKAYGKWFLSSLPPATAFRGPINQVLDQVRGWLAQPNQETP